MHDIDKDAFVNGRYNWFPRNRGVIDVWCSSRRCPRLHSPVFSYLWGKLTTDLYFLSLTKRLDICRWGRKLLISMPSFLHIQIYISQWRSFSPPQFESITNSGYHYQGEITQSSQTIGHQKKVQDAVIPVHSANLGRPTLVAYSFGRPSVCSWSRFNQPF